MRLFRPTYTRNGVRKKSSVWWVQASILGDRFRKSTRCRDRRAAMQKALEMIRDAERIAAGLEDPFEKHWARPIAEHLDDFEANLRAGDVVEQYVRDRMGRLRAFVKYAGYERLRDLDDGDAVRWLLEEKARGLAARTVNRRYQALRQFARWLVAAQRVPRAPFVTLKRLNEKKDRRRVRRAVTREELGRLLTAAASRPLETERQRRVTAGVSNSEVTRLTHLGQVRAAVYRLAAGTGLRKGELKRLRWIDVDIEQGWVAVPADSSKSGEDQEVPLRADLASMLMRIRPPKARATALVFPTALFPSLRAYKRDLAAAGIIKREFIERASVDGKRLRPREVFDIRDERGRVVDFHSLRYTFVSRLTQVGVSPKHAQELARHTQVDLTMNVYTEVSRAELRAAIERTGSDEEE